MLAGIVVLVTVGLLSSNLAAYALLASFFERRAERQLATTGDRIGEVFARRPDARTIDQGLRMVAGGRVVAAVVDSTGRVRSAPRSDAPRQAALVQALTPSLVTRLREHPGRSFPLDVADDPYRVVYRRLAGGGGASGTAVAGVIIAIPLRQDQETLRRFAVDTAAVTAVVLLTLVCLALAVLRIGLRPLRTMAAAATAIAAGDRTQRIRVGHPQSEAGRLAVALNDAFDRQRQVEGQLRRFVADVSHELRTPLSTISGWADLYFHGALTDKDSTTTAMSRIVDAAAGMRSLVDELLLLARLDQQRPLETAPVSLRDLVSEVVSDARVIAPDRVIALVTQDHDRAMVTGDAARLRQLARNLLSNALQHTPSDVRVHVTVMTRPDGIHLVVVDEGPGVPAEIRPHLFARFSAGDPVRRPGSGLGLAIARAIAEAHGGTIRLRDPAHGHGAEFVVILPAASREKAP
ncbi:hypothetical protein Acsp03_50010 [Actinomadura sp. NBRC 104412]|nr:hypothetical protein Acsp03_50010 [Actinomadura sp. NBRC 104412]